MVSDEYITKAMQKDLESVGFHSIGLYASEHRDFIDSIHKNRINDEAIDKVLEAKVFHQANADYIKILSSQVDRNGIFLDDWSVHPQCLVYAWKKGKLSDRQFIEIPIDHGYTMATVGDRYQTKDMISELRKIFLTAKFEPSVEGISRSACESYHCCNH